MFHQDGYLIPFLMYTLGRELSKKTIIKLKFI